MKTKKLITRIRALFDADLRNNLKTQQSLHEVLEQLRAKEKKLQESLPSEQSPEKREETQLKIDLVHSQRKKGVAMLKQAQSSVAEEERKSERKGD